VEPELLLDPDQPEPVQQALRDLLLEAEPGRPDSWWQAGLEDSVQA
jgi:hypothetical protein